MPDWLAPIAYIPAYWGMLLLVGGAAALVFYVVWRSLNGDTRTWAVLPHFPLQVSHHNTWPFMLAMIGIGLVTLLPTVFFEAWAMEGARQSVWNVFLVPAALVALSFFWWPLAWTPTWFKNWALRSKIDPETNPWTDAASSARRLVVPSTRTPDARRKRFSGSSSTNPTGLYGLSGSASICLTSEIPASPAPMTMTGDPAEGRCALSCARRTR